MKEHFKKKLRNSEIDHLGDVLNEEAARIYREHQSYLVEKYVANQCF